MPQIKMMCPKKLQPLMTTKKRYVVIMGGRGGGKSQTVANILIQKCAIDGLNILCCREFNESIRDSIYSMICDEIERLGVPGFIITNNEIRHSNGAKIIFKGLAINVESVKSIHNIDLAVVDEAQSLSERSIDIFTPSIRNEGSSIWFIANPRSSEDPFSKLYINPFLSALDSHGIHEDEDRLIIRVNWYDNPMFPKSLHAERRVAKQTMSAAKYEHIWEGRFLDEIEDAIICREWFDACIDAHLTDSLKGSLSENGGVFVSHDPSDKGSDYGGLCVRRGSVITHIDEYDGNDGNEGCDWAIDCALRERADEFIYDADGMGALLRRQITDALSPKRVGIHEFRGSNSVDEAKSRYNDILDHSKIKTNQEVFRNKRAQYYIKLRDRIYNTYRAIKFNEYNDPEKMISFNSKMPLIDKLRAEVCRIPLKYSGNGLIQIMPKPEMRKMGIASPNLADSVMMSLIDSVAKSHTKINFVRYGF